MSIKVVTGNTQVRQVRSGSTQVKRVTVGTPVRIIRRVQAADFNFGNLAGVNITDAVNGSLLVYNEVTEDFEAKTEIDNEIINFNGGNF